MGNGRQGAWRSDCAVGCTHVPFSYVVGRVTSLFQLCCHPSHVPRDGTVGVTRRRQLGQHVNREAAGVERRSRWGAHHVDVLLHNRSWGQFHTIEQL